MVKSNGLWISHYALLAAFVLSMLTDTALLRGEQQVGGWPRGGAKSSEKILASPLVADVDDDGNVEIIIPSYDNQLYIYNHDGNPRAGWPVSMNTGDGTMSSPALGDVTGDGMADVVVMTDDNESKHATVKVFSISGSQITTASLTFNSNASGKGTPCLVNCRKYSGTQLHSALEVVVRDGDGLVHILSWEGSSLSEFTDDSFNTCPEGTAVMDRFGFQQITPSVSAITLGDSSTYIVAASTNSRVYRWQLNSYSSPGDNLQILPLNSFVAETTGVKFLASPVIYDLDGDGDHEIVAGATNGLVYVWEGDGSGAQFAGNWPRATGQTILSSPAVAALDPGTTQPCIVIGSNDRRLYAWYSDGNAVPGWPVQTDGQIFSSPVAAQTDRVPGLEVFVASLDGYLNGWTWDGDRLDGWPKRMNTQLFSSPAIADFRRSKRMSIVFGGYNGRVFMFDLSHKSAELNAGWRQFRGGPERQGHP